ncbi:MAG: caspase family protein [bacterium]|nr:caspase family protein [bacterium]
MLIRSILMTLISLILILVAASPAFAARNEISPGQTIESRLDTDDDQLEDGCYFETYTIDCEPGTLVTISESSDKMDCYLIVTGSRDSQWENDDITSDILDSRVTVMITDPADFEIIATTFSEETGAYTLTVEEIVRPEYFGVFVGIEDYGEEFASAPLCDQDAENLVDAFIQSDLMERDHTILLTNEDAELADVEDAMDEMSRMVGPDDVFIFFFSGHGDRVEASAENMAGEIDGMDETLALRDQNLVDDHLAEMLNAIDAGLKVAVMDSCYAGGVAEDVSRYPKTVGLASSEEDVLSDFATELDAGGFLSVFFKEAISGDADLDGDGIVMIGELARYLRIRYLEDGPTTEQAMYGYPELVDERGLVTQDTIFCWWVETGNRHSNKD